MGPEAGKDMLAFDLFFSLRENGENYRGDTCTATSLRIILPPTLTTGTRLESTNSSGLWEHIVCRFEFLWWSLRMVPRSSDAVVLPVQIVFGHHSKCLPSPHVTPVWSLLNLSSPVFLDGRLCQEKRIHNSQQVSNLLGMYKCIKADGFFSILSEFLVAELVSLGKHGEKIKLRPLCWDRNALSMWFKSQLKVAEIEQIAWDSHFVRLTSA